MSGSSSARGRVVYVKSEVEHQELMDGGAVLPVLLQMAGGDAGTPVARM